MRHNHLHNTINSKRIGLELLHERGLFHIKKQNKTKIRICDPMTLTLSQWQKNMKIPTIYDKRTWKYPQSLHITKYANMATVKRTTGRPSNLLEAGEEWSAWRGQPVWKAEWQFPWCPQSHPPGHQCCPSWSPWTGGPPGWMRCTVHTLTTTHERKKKPGVMHSSYSWQLAELPMEKNNMMRCKVHTLTTTHRKK